MSMADAVGERFADNAIGRHFHCRWQRGQSVRRLDQYLHAARLFGIPGSMLLEGADQPQLIERWRPETVHQSADILDRLLHLLFDSSDPRLQSWLLPECVA